MLHAHRPPHLTPPPTLPANAMYPQPVAMPLRRRPELRYETHLASCPPAATTATVPTPSSACTFRQPFRALKDPAALNPTHPAQHTSGLRASPIFSDLPAEPAAQPATRPRTANTRHPSESPPHTICTASRTIQSLAVFPARTTPHLARPHSRPPPPARHLATWTPSRTIMAPFPGNLRPGRHPDFALSGRLTEENVTQHRPPKARFKR